MRIFAALLVAGLCVFAQAQAHRDPLTAREVDQMRENAQDPAKRIDLLLGFARERVLAIDGLRGKPKPSPADAGKIADLLSDLAALIDELDDNLEMYNGHSEDLRHPLRHVLQAEAEFQQKLRALSDHADPLEKPRFAEALEDVSDALQDSMEGARAMLTGQLEKKGQEKNKQKSARPETPQTPGAQAPEAQR